MALLLRPNVKPKSWPARPRLLSFKGLVQTLSAALCSTAIGRFPYYLSFGVNWFPLFFYLYFIVESLAHSLDRW